MIRLTRLAPLAVCLLCACCAWGFDPTIAQPKAGSGATFASRDIYTCNPEKAQMKGPPNSQQAEALVMCSWEKVTGSGTLSNAYLTENVVVQVGSGRPYEYGDGSGDADVKQAVYPIRGSFVYDRCFPINSAYPAGKSCKKIEHPNASGICYKTNFGDWKCQMSDGSTYHQDPGYFPAPR